jgi:hypothetical protein
MNSGSLLRDSQEGIMSMKKDTMIKINNAVYLINLIILMNYQLIIYRQNRQ